MIRRVSDVGIVNPRSYYDSPSRCSSRNRRRSSVLLPVALSSWKGFGDWCEGMFTSSCSWIANLVVPISCSILGWFGSCLRWVPTSMASLQNAEKKVLSYLKTVYVGRYVDIGTRVGNKDNRVWTLALNTSSPNTPLVMVHGFAAGVALWVLNLDALAKYRPVYVFDLLGFGRSSRPSFSADAQEAETQLVESIEDWREKMNLDNFILLGHSMGAFLATSYTLRYPERVKHLVLADPWGFGVRPVEARPSQLPLWIKAVVTMLQPFNPLAGLRAAGPWGPRLVEKLRPDLKDKFHSVTGDDTDAIPNYIYHCNAQNPSGEAAFKAMTEMYGWAKLPMVNRVGSLSQDIPITMIYGARSWVDRKPGFQIKNHRTDCAKVTIHLVRNAGHHVYADEPSAFNDLVQYTCNHEDGVSTPESLQNVPSSNEVDFDSNDATTVYESEWERARSKRSQPSAQRNS